MSVSFQSVASTDATLTVESAAQPKNDQVGSLLSRSVKWFRGEEDSTVAQVFKKILAIAIAALLAFSIIGIVVVIDGAREWKKQDKALADKLEAQKQQLPSEGETGSPSESGEPTDVLPKDTGSSSTVVAETILGKTVQTAEETKEEVSGEEGKEAVVADTAPVVATLPASGADSAVTAAKVEEKALPTLDIHPEAAPKQKTKSASAPVTPVHSDDEEEEEEAAIPSTTAAATLVVADEKKDAPVVAVVADEKKDAPVAEEKEGEPAAAVVADEKKDAPVVAVVADEKKDAPVAEEKKAAPVADEKKDEPVVVVVADEKKATTVAEAADEESSDDESVTSEEEIQGTK